MPRGHRVGGDLAVRWVDHLGRRVFDPLGYREGDKCCREKAHAPGDVGTAQQENDGAVVHVLGKEWDLDKKAEDVGEQCWHVLGAVSALGIAKRRNIDLFLRGEVRSQLG